MKIGIPKEIKNHEYRVGMTPSAVREAVNHGHKIVVETNAGNGIGSDDDTYRAAGAIIVDSAQEVFTTADMIVKVKEPQANERKMLREGQVLVVPRGVEHRPVSTGECSVMLIEPAGLVNTGDADATEASTTGTWLRDDQHPGHDSNVRPAD